MFLFYDGSNHKVKLFHGVRKKTGLLPVCLIEFMTKTLEYYKNVYTFMISITGIL